MKATARNVALLVPVPLEFLLDGQRVGEREGKVAFGSRAWQVFRELEELRSGHPVDVYIYASHTDGPLVLDVTWHAEYMGHVDSIAGAHPAGMQYRPPSTGKYANDNEGHWAVFWEVQGLRQLPTPNRLRLADLAGFAKRNAYRPGFVREGPCSSSIDEPGLWPVAPDRAAH
jgi:hypothetical protein